MRVETMNSDEKILNALKGAASYLQASMKVLDDNDEAFFSGNIWHVGAELEYALFLFSMIFHEEHDSSKWKPKIEPKENLKPILLEVNNLLEQAQECMGNRKLQDAFQNVFAARHYVFKIQADIAKKKRESSKKK